MMVPCSRVGEGEVTFGAVMDSMKGGPDSAAGFESLDKNGFVLPEHNYMMSSCSAQS
jgi:hypothetical protein